MKKKEFTISKNPRIRIPTIDSGKICNNKYYLIVLLEIDITNLKSTIHLLREKNIHISFNSCIVKMISDSVAENKHLQAALINDRKMAIFDNVDIFIAVERSINGGRYPYPFIIRSANQKTAMEITREIEAEAEKKIKSDSELFLPDIPKLGKLVLAIFYILPPWLRRLTISMVINNPFRARKIIGTVGFATVNVIGRLSGWTFPNKNMHSLYFALGSITKKPMIVKDEIRARDVMNLTVMIDHNIVDGTPVKSFLNQLVERIEKGEIF